MEKLFCYQTPTALPMVPARASRGWMDATDSRFAYRCLPLSMANSTGWELLSPCSFKAKWDGGRTRAAITFTQLDDFPHFNSLAVSHFAHGVLTFHTGWLFRTPPGWGLAVSGPPNWPKGGLMPLSGLVETEWLPFPFTMNWLFTHPGEVTFHKDEPLCFIQPVPHALLHTIQPVTLKLEDNPALAEQSRQWGENRAEFLKNLTQGDAQTVQQGWQRHYMHGKDATGSKTEAFHLTNRRMLAPRPATAQELAALALPHPPTKS